MISNPQRLRPNIRCRKFFHKEKEFYFVCGDLIVPGGGLSNKRIGATNKDQFISKLEAFLFFLKDHCFQKFTLVLT